MKTNMNRQQKRALKKRKPGRPPDKWKPDAKSINVAWDVFKLVTFTALHDKYGWGKPRLDDLNTHIQSGVEAVTGNFASIYDLNETLINETGVEVIERERYKQKWKVRNYD